MNRLIPATILHLDLAVGLTEKSLGTEGEAAYIVFWWRDIPLGHLQLDGDAFPMPEAQLWSLGLQTVAPAVGAYVLERGFEAPLPESPRGRLLKEPADLRELVALENPLQTLDRSRPGGGSTRISVVICTRNRPEGLERCLRSLLSCSRMPDEIVVLDNCPSSNATEELVKRYPQVRYTRETRPGLDFARNTGIRHTRGTIIAFVDDDVTVHPEWVVRLAECFSDPQVSAVTGLLLPAELETEAQCLFEEHWGFHRGYRVQTYDSRYFEELRSWGVPAYYVGAGANMAFRREAFDRLGDFDVRLDVGAAGCSGDSEFWYRLLAEGLACRYDPRVTAFHYHRRDMKALRHQVYSYMRGHTAALLVQFARHRHWGNLVRLLFLLPLYYARLVAQGVRRGFKPRHRLIPMEVVGCLSGVLFFLRNMRSPSTDHLDGEPT